MPELLVVAAHPAELAGLPPEVRRSPVGVGLVESAAGMATILAVGAPAGVILIGTCGTFSTAFLPNDLVVVERATFAAASYGVEVPEAVVPRADADVTLTERLVQLTGARRVLAACGAGVTTDDAIASKTAALHRAQVEHMEAFSVFRACARTGTPVSALLAVANRVGEGARAEWKANCAVAEARAIEALMRAWPELSATGG